MLFYAFLFFSICWCLCITFIRSSQGPIRLVSNHVTSFFQIAKAPDCSVCSIQFFVQIVNWHRHFFKYTGGQYLVFFIPLPTPPDPNPPSTTRLKALTRLGAVLTFCPLYYQFSLPRNSLLSKRKQFSWIGNCINASEKPWKWVHLCTIFYWSFLPTTQIFNLSILQSRRNPICLDLFLAPSGAQGVTISVPGSLVCFKFVSIFIILAQVSLRSLLGLS